MLVVVLLVPHQPDNKNLALKLALFIFFVMFFTKCQFQLRMCESVKPTPKILLFLWELSVVFSLSFSFEDWID